MTSQAEAELVRSRASASGGERGEPFMLKVAAKIVGGGGLVNDGSGGEGEDKEGGRDGEGE